MVINTGLIQACIVSYSQLGKRSIKVVFYPQAELLKNKHENSKMYTVNYISRCIINISITIKSGLLR